MPNKGDRALALLPRLVRCWELLHRQRVRRWARHTNENGMRPSRAIAVYDKHYVGSSRANAQTP
eukprot:5765982-Pyramimonas_sp.AAC.3